MLRWIAGLLSLIVMLSGCMDASVISIPPEVEEKTETVLDALLEQDSGYLAASLPDQMMTEEEAVAALEDIYTIMIDAEVVERKLVGRSWRTHASTSAGMYTDYESTYQIEYAGDDYASAFIQIRRENGEDSLYFLNYYQMEQSYEEAFRFSLAGKSPFHYAVLLLTIAVAILVLATVITIIRRWRRLRSPIKWLVFSLVGVGQLSLDWTTGLWTLKLLYVQVLGAGFTKMTAYEPLILMVSIPIGAILFWFRATPKPKDPGEKQDPEIETAEGA